MPTHTAKNYRKVADLIIYMTEHLHGQPSAQDLSSFSGLDTSEIRTLFRDYVGISPKQFLKVLSIEHAKGILATGAPLTSVAADTGLSSTGRLHDLFVTVEAMTPGEYKNFHTPAEHVTDESRTLFYSVHESLFGTILIASTSRGICHMTFVDDADEGIDHVQMLFPRAHLICEEQQSHRTALDLLSAENHAQTPESPLALHVRGTPFQIKVWKALLEIPAGSLTTYGSLAKHIGHDKAHRAVGTAVGRNPISYIIPCHRVIQSSGVLGNYMWGPERKKMMIARETSVFLRT